MYKYIGWSILFRDGMAILRADKSIFRGLDGPKAMCT